MIIGIIFSVFYYYYYIHAHKGISLCLVMTISANFGISLGILSTLIISKAFYQIKVTLTEAILSFLALGVLLNASSSGIAETIISEKNTQTLQMLIGSTAFATYAVGLFLGYMRYITQKNKTK